MANEAMTNEAMTKLKSRQATRIRQAIITEASLEEKVNEGTRQDQTSEQFLFCLDLECMSWTLWNVNGIRTHALSAGKPPLERAGHKDQKYTPRRRTWYSIVLFIEWFKL